MSMMILRRSFHVGRCLWNPPPTVEKSSLAKLRKTTGYSFSKCKEALEKHQNDLKEAEGWLRNQAQAHGWEKATKLQGRATAQGLISVLANSSNAVMVETNCETDFVARNKKFQTLVQRITSGCLQYTSEQKQEQTGNTLLTSVRLSSEQLGNVPVSEFRPVKDETAISIGELGENIKNRRAIYFKATAPVVLAGYTHPLPEGGSVTNKDQVQFGRYGVVVAYRPTSQTDTESSEKQNTKNSNRMEEIGRQLCQHIVGMNPTEIGVFKPRAAEPAEEEENTASTTASTSVSESVGTSSSSSGSDAEDLDDAANAELYPESNETSLINQEFLLDPELTVGEFLLENGIEVLDFTRFECGEANETSQLG